MPGLRGQAGVGTAGDNASTSASWGWAEATFTGAVSDAGLVEDEMTATFHPAYSGTRAVSFRFSVDDGGTWTYCDLNGSDVNGYEVAQQYGVTVGGATNIDYCNLQFPPMFTAAADAGGDVYGQIYLAGVTTRPYPGVTAQAGWGHKIEDPGVASSWTWVNASYNPRTMPPDNNDEYVGHIKPDAGTWSYAFRFSTDNGASYCFGDLDGNGKTGTFNGETGTGGENLGVATVTP